MLLMAAVLTFPCVGFWAVFSLVPRARLMADVRRSDGQLLGQPILPDWLHESLPKFLQPYTQNIDTARWDQTPPPPGTLSILARFDTVEHITFRGTDMPDAELWPLSGVRSLKTLELQGPRFTDGALDPFVNVPGLEELYLVCPRMTDAVTERIERMPSLTKIVILDGSVTDAGLRRLAKLPRLRGLYLGLAGTPGVTDQGLSHLCGHKALRKLAIYEGRGISDVGVEHLATLSQLESLKINDTRVTDEGLKDLARLRHLHTLDLFCAKVTDRGLDHVKTMKVLRRLNVRGTGVSEAKVAELEAVIPGLKVMH